MNTRIYLLIITLTTSYSAFSTGNIRLQNEQLLASCQSLTERQDEQSAQACIYFIRGFIAAPRIVVPPIINNKNKVNHKFYGFMSSSYRNRTQIPSTRFFPFCIPEKTSKPQAIKTVSKQLLSQFDTIEIPENEVFKALKSEFPCSAKL